MMVSCRRQSHKTIAQEKAQHTDSQASETLALQWYANGTLALRRDLTMHKKSRSPAPA